jgi:isoamylase
MFDAYWEPLEFELPHGCTGTWKRWIDTALDAPNDIVPWPDSPIVPGLHDLAGARSVVALHAPYRRITPADRRPRRQKAA